MSSKVEEFWPKLASFLELAAQKIGDVVPAEAEFGKIVSESLSRLRPLINYARDETKRMKKEDMQKTEQMLLSLGVVETLEASTQLLKKTIASEKAEDPPSILPPVLIASGDQMSTFGYTLVALGIGWLGWAFVATGVFLTSSGESLAWLLTEGEHSFMMNRLAEVEDKLDCIEKKLDHAEEKLDITKKIDKIEGKFTPNFDTQCTRIPILTEGLKPEIVSGEIDLNEMRENDVVTVVTKKLIEARSGATPGAFEFKWKILKTKIYQGKQADGIKHFEDFAGVSELPCDGFLVEIAQSASHDNWATPITIPWEFIVESQTKIRSPRSL